MISQLLEALGKNSFVDYSLQALIEFVRYNFVWIQNNYVMLFANQINPIMQNTGEESNCVVAMEFWSIFAREEHSIESNPNMNKFLTGQLAEQLVESLLQNLCFIEETDEEANGIS